MKLKHSSSYCVACVCDGHYGKRAAHFAARHLPKRVFDELSAEAPKQGFLRGLMEHASISGRSSSRSTLASSVDSVSLPSRDSGAPPAESLPALLSRCYHDVDAAWLSYARAQQPQQPDGTTALLLLLDKRAGLCTVANAGDSRGVAAVSGSAHVLSRDHNGKSDAERARIEALPGGDISIGGRVRGKLAVTRAIGDLPYKEGACEVICEPEVQSIAISEALHFVILACDGVWDKFSSVDAVKFVQRSLASDGGSAERAARELAQAALDRGSEDNVSITLLVFEHTCDGGVLPPPDMPPDSDSENAGSDMEEGSLDSRRRGTAPPPLDVSDGAAPRPRQV